MKFNIDVGGMEQQRYNAIKDKGEYIEVNILIGTEKEHFGDFSGTLPVVTTIMNNVRPT